MHAVKLEGGQEVKKHRTHIVCRDRSPRAPGARHLSPSISTAPYTVRGNGKAEAQPAGMPFCWNMDALFRKGMNLSGEKVAKERTYSHIIGIGAGPEVDSQEFW